MDELNTFPEENNDDPVPAEDDVTADESPVEEDVPAAISDTDDDQPGGRGLFTRLRWQIVVLVLGVVMIIAAIIFSFTGKGSPALPDLPETADSQTYTEAAVGLPRYVNPLLAASRTDRELSSLVFSGLTRLNQYGEPMPDLAQSWEVSDDGLTYVFKLRKDVTWHDGAPFTAEDVSFTMSVLRDPDYTGSADLGRFWRTIETYADDEYTVRFVLTQPLAAFPEYAGVGILPAHLLAGIAPADLPTDSFNLTPVGTGQFIWDSSTLDERNDLVTVHLIANTGYYEARRVPALEDIYLYYYADPGDAVRALGEVQGFGGLTDQQLEAVFEAGTMQVYSARLPVYATVIFNQQSPTRLPFFQNADVRQALTLALDREGIVYNTLGHQALPAYSPVLPGTWAYHAMLEPLRYAPDQAALLLDGAGYPILNGVRANDAGPISFTLLVSDTDQDAEIGALIVQQWQAVGVDAKVQVVPPAAIFERLQAAPGEEGREFDAVLVKFTQGRLADPDPYPFWHEAQYESGQNFGGVADFDISNALEIARKDSNGVRRAELYREFQERFTNQAEAILIYNPVYHYAVSCAVDGVQLSILIDPVDRFRNIHEWRIVSPQEAEANCP